LLSEEAFNTQHGNLFDSNLFGEDISQIVNIQRINQKRINEPNEVVWNQSYKE
jgi:hypothetical protein